MGGKRKTALDLKMLEAKYPLNPLHYNEDRVLIGHEVVPMDRQLEGVYWCEVCGGHPEDPIHQPGYEP